MDATIRAERDSLRERARLVVATADLAEKVDLAYRTARDWFGRRLDRGTGTIGPALAERPGRPEHPILLPPREMKRRSAVGLQGRIALLHSLAHIELNAVDLTWDLVARFVDQAMPRSFFDDWVQVASRRPSISRCSTAG
ncbi:hypothetical protein A6302_02903 [Methylobrevis pamukkalensis]|uniref:Uncharacterized protein n=1 Tax=Methylobrevis pamukkalensis TaxID=1439726 RepID=A0A1E3H2L6_9HYPH|nr:hypothetical protein A6302_02903 [Methylobrevis pamukkalensis]